jgi:hypothetical protein
MFISFFSTTFFLKSMEIINKMRLCNRIYYSNVYWRLNMFRAAHLSSSGAPNYICSLWFTYTCGDRPLSRLSGKWIRYWSSTWSIITVKIPDPFPTQTWLRPVTICVCKPDAANTVWSSWWWSVFRSKHVEPSINVGKINSLTRLHLVGISTDSYCDARIHGY